MFTLACCGCLVMSSSCLGASQASPPAAPLLLAVLAVAAAMSASLQLQEKVTRKSNKKGWQETVKRCHQNVWLGPLRADWSMVVFWMSSQQILQLLGA
jgi:hypothetical protein